MLNFIIRLIDWVKYRYSRTLSRVSSKKRIKEISPERILVLCYGNIYRSPFVEFYINKIQPEAKPLEIRSAGFHQVVNRSSKTGYIEYCLKKGVDLSGHRSRLVDRVMVDWADVIVIMDGHNFKMFSKKYREFSDKLIWLGSLSPDTPVVIADPYGLSEYEQDKIVSQLMTSC